MYECEHGDKIIREIQPEYIIKVCDKCFKEFINLKTRPLFLAKQILSLSNKMIEKQPEFNDEQSIDKSIKLWHHIANRRLNEVKYVLGKRDKPDYLGKLYRFIGESTCLILGKFCKKTDWSVLYNKKEI